MKSTHIFTVLTVMAFTSTILAENALDQYEINWFSIDGGGGESVGEGYQLRGTIGQPDASIVSQTADLGEGSFYALAGGYWSTYDICVVELYDLHKFVEFWLDSGTGIPADLDRDNIVNLHDFHELHFYWLGVCPQDWPL